MSAAQGPLLNTGARDDFMPPLTRSSPCAVPIDRAGFRVRSLASHAAAARAPPGTRASLAAQRADPTFGVRACLRRSHRRLDDADPFGAEDLVELTGELAVAITDQEPRSRIVAVEGHQQVARLLSHPPAIRVRRDPREPHATGRQFDEEQDVKPLQEQRVDGEEVALEDTRRLRSQKLGPARLEALRCRLDPRLLQDRPHRAGGELDSKAYQLALDSPVAPTRVLTREPHHQLTRIGRRCWPAGTAMRIRPTTRDEFSVPAQERRRLHECRPPPCLPRQHPAERSQERTISLRQLGTSNLTLQHPE